MWNHHACVLSFHCCHLHHSHFCRNLCFTYKKSPLVVSVLVILMKTPNLHYHNDNLFLQKATFTFVNCRDEITLPRITHREQMAAAQQTLVSCHMNQCDDASALKQPSHAQPACKISRCSIPLHSNKALPS